MDGGAVVDVGGGAIVNGVAKRAFRPKSASHSSKNSRNSSSIAEQRRRDGAEWSEKKKWFIFIKYITIRLVSLETSFL